MNKKAKAQKASTQSPVESIDTLAQQCSRPITIPFGYAGKQYEIQTRHLMPFEKQILRLQRSRLVPPVIKGKTEKEDRFNWDDPNYREQSELLDIQQRALAIFWATPFFQKQEKGKELVADMYKPDKRDAIIQLVQSYFTDEIHEVIYAGIESTELSVAERINFTSPVG